MSVKKWYHNRGFRVLSRLVGIILLLFAATLLFVRSSWGQDIIIDKVVGYLANKTKTRVEVEKLYITFNGNILLKGLYLEDQQGDTLIYSKQLEASLALVPLIQGDKIHLKKLAWSGLKTRIAKEQEALAYNYEFLVDAFSSPSDTTETTTQPPTEPMAMEVGNLEFSDFDISIKDEVSGLQASLHLGDLMLEMREIDLAAMKFHLGETSISNTSIFYEQSKRIATVKDTTSSSLPYIAIDALRLNNVKATYKDQPQELGAKIEIGDFLLKLPKADLNQKKIVLSSLAINKSYFNLETATKVNPTPMVSEEKDTLPSFIWPDWDISVAKISLNDNQFSYQDGNVSPTKGHFNAKDLDFSEVSLQLSEISLRDKKAQLALDGFSFREKSGFAINELAFKFIAGQRDLSLTNLVLGTSNSGLQGKVLLQYESIDQLIRTPEKTRVNVDFPLIQLGVSDAYVFQPALEKNPYFKSLGVHPLKAKFTADGTLENLQIDNTAIAWGKATTVEIKGSVRNPMDSKSLDFDMSKLNFRTDKKAISSFVSESQLGIDIPESLIIKAQAKGSLEDVVAKLSINIPEGDLLFDGQLTSKNTLAFKGLLQVKELELDKLLQNDALGKIGFTANIWGKGKDINSLDAGIQVDFSDLQLLNYDYSNLSLNGELKKGKGAVLLNFKDNNLDLSANTIVALDSISPEFNVFMDLKGADFSALGITKDDIRATLKLNANFKGNGEQFEFLGTITDGATVYKKNSYPIDDVVINTKVDDNGTHVNMRSKMLMVAMESNKNPEHLLAALRQQFSSYLEDSIRREEGIVPTTMKMDLSVHKTPMLEKVLLPGLERMEDIKLHFDYKEAHNTITANFQAPFIQYKDSKVDSLHLNLEGVGAALKFTFGIGGLESGPLMIKKTYFDGAVKDKTLYLDFNAMDHSEKLLYIATQIEKQGDTIALHINPTSLIFNKKQWQIPADNQLLYAPNYIKAKDFILSRNQQELAVSSAFSDQQKEHIGVQFSNFRLSTFSSLLNPDESLAKGTLKGNFILEDPFGSTGLVTDLAIDQLEVTGIPLGHLATRATSKNGNNYDFDLKVNGGDLDLSVNGDFIAAESGAQLNLDLLLNELKIKALEQFAPGAITETSGSVNGKFKVSGTLAEPLYQGSFNFDKAGLLLKSLNTRFTMADETVSLDNKGIYLRNFTITDANNNRFALDGEVGTKNLLNPTFALKVKAKDFQVINATSEDNEQYYGKVKMDADMTLSGNLKTPKITGTLRVNEGSDFTFVVPESQLDITEREGVVIFVNKENPNDILTRNKDDGASSAILTGYSIDTQLSVENNATFTIVIDERSGDNFQISGKGDFIVGVEPSGRTTLSGRYEVKKGHYEASLYNLVKRRFEISPGSSIIWNGDPLDATLDIKAIYKVETSAAPLMATKISTQNAAESSKYKQKVPFLVYLNVDGSLLLPELSFNLDIPEAEQGAFGGAVYGQVQQLNKQEEELNKQVFSLLVLNRFFPGATSDGSSGGAASIARDNVNKVLSGQLNNFSEKLIGKTGVDLDFGLDSFTDYQGDAPQDRTQLDISASKRLFNNRLIVQVGSEVDLEGSSQVSGEGTPVIGNVNLEYLLTENGRFRIKGFRKNEFESVIDGQLIVTGVALIFNREFNKFKELWVGQLKDDESKKEAQKQEKGGQKE
ncbi:translocation/assembly module TamB [Arenibacter sp. 6A1]|uniref:translocation/assembly module TamB domain-containing protein n=1 Tax=Arenibacter sp. 6A1 TaxID=2720391 RepID=UPI001446CCD8|nr:translocation/assembly module TamB [Arenibacter sp. 6A1]NKI25793.1 translocation/assembly module TamB [Arenibacter sp. 6A1]